MIIKKFNPDRVPKEIPPKYDKDTEVTILDRIKGFVDKDKTYEEVRDYLRKQEDLPKLTGHEANSLIKKVDDEWRLAEKKANEPEDPEDPVKDPIKDPVKEP